MGRTNETSVLIANRIRNSIFHDHLNHQIRCRTLICYITVADDTYCLFLVSATVSVTIVFDMAVWNRIDFTMEIRPSLDLAHTIFEKYTWTTRLQ
jgi:hypothetical protein